MSTSGDLAGAGGLVGLDAAAGESDVRVSPDGSEGGVGCPSPTAYGSGSSSWAQATQTGGSPSAVWIVVKGACDDALVYGRAHAATQWGGGSLPAGGFLSHLDATGREDWVRSITDTNTGVSAMSALPGGRFAAAGELVGPVDFGNGPRVGVGGDSDAFVARYDPTGALLSFAQYGDDPAQWASGLASNGLGDLALFATGYGNADFGAGTATPAGWLVGFHAASTNPWVVSSFLGTPGAVALDSQGLVTIAGGLTGPINLGDGMIGVANGEYDPHEQFYVASYDATGRLRWSKGFLEGSLGSLVAQPDGDIVLAGAVGTPGLDLGCGVTPPGATSYVAALGSDRTCRWMQWFTGTLDAHVTVDGAGGSVVVGRADSAPQDASGPLPGVGAIYVERFGADGAPSGGQVVGALQSGNVVSINSVAASRTAVWLGGTITGNLEIAGAMLNVPVGADEGYVARLAL